MRTLPFLSLLCLFLSSCCREARPTSIADSTPDLLALLRQPGAGLPTLRGELRVDHMGPEGRISGKVYAFAAEAGRLRLEAVSPLETTLQTVAIDGESFSLVDQENGRCLLGRAEPCLVGQAVGLELSSSHVGAALLGAVPLIRHRRADSRWDRCGFYEVELEGEVEGWRQVVRLEPQEGRLLPVEATISGPAGTVLEMSLGRYEPVGDRLVPRALRISMPQSEADLTVEWRELEVGVTLPERAWQILCPPGFSTEEATCQPRGDLPELEPPGGDQAEGPVQDGGVSDADPDQGDAGPLVEGDGGQVEGDGDVETDLSDELGL